MVIRDGHIHNSPWTTPQYLIDKELVMAKYLVTYHGSAAPTDPAMLEQVKAAFGQWLQEAGSAVVDPGAPVRMVKQVANGTPSAVVDIGGYSIIEAPSLEAAESILQTHPYVGRGGTLQVNEVVVL
jgi:hypothetical protein